MTVNEMDLIGRLGEVEPLPDEALMRAEAILQAAIETSSSAEREQANIRGRVQVRRRRGLSRRYVVGATGLAGAVLAVTAALAGPGTHGRAPNISGTHGRAPNTQPAIVDASATLRLASDTFKLPAGYHTIDSGCAALPSGLTPAVQSALPMAGESSLAAAASRSGGCIEAVLAEVGGATIPAGAQPVKIGPIPYQGFVAQGGAASVLLYVELPTAQGSRYLVLLGNGLNASQLIAIADSGLPWRTAPTERP